MERKVPSKLIKPNFLQMGTTFRYHENSVTKKRIKRLMSAMTGFGKETTIHGLNRVFASKVSWIERTFWTLIFLLALIVLIFVSQVIGRRYFHRQLKTIIDSTSYPLYKIYFPEVVICNENRLNWAYLEEAKRRFLLPYQRNTTDEQLFTEIVALYDDFIYGGFDRFGNLPERALRNLNYVNFTQVARFMTWRCHELLTDCVWRRRGFDCCDIFIRRRSQMGLCMAFNSVDSAHGNIKLLLDSKWPWRVTDAGQGTGLSVRVLLNEKKHSPFAQQRKGVSIMVVEPYVWFYYPKFVRQNTKAVITLDAMMTLSDPETRSVPSNVRECVFQDERSSRDFKSLYGHKYMLENCISECQQEYLMHYCNCTMDIFFPTGQYPICKLADLPCVAANNHRLLYFEQTSEEWRSMYNRRPDFDCKCMPNCRSLRYMTETKSYALQPDEVNPNMSYIDMDFSFKFDYILVYRTKLVFTWIDLLASFGGVAALFLGSSLISLVELIYFFLVRVPKSKFQEDTKPDHVNLDIHKKLIRRKSKKITMKFRGFD